MPLQIIDVLTPETRVRLRERMNDLTEQARARFRDTVVPIYGSKPNGRPVHIGSATLLDVNGHKVLLTAAHIIDENKFTTLYVGVGKELELASGQFSATPAPGGRDSDHYDFAFYEIPDELVAKITGRFVALNEIAQSGRSEAGRLYTALGYPNSKNRKYDPDKLTVKPRLFPYSSVHKVDAEIAAKLPGDGDHHIFMTYDKDSRDDDGAVVNSTAPKGMSGGPVIDAGRAGDLQVFLGNENPIPLLAGIVIELKKKRVLLAVRIEVILPFLLVAFPDQKEV